MFPSLRRGRSLRPLHQGSLANHRAFASPIGLARLLILLLKKFRSRALRLVGVLGHAVAQPLGPCKPTRCAPNVTLRRERAELRFGQRGLPPPCFGTLLKKYTPSHNGV